MYVDRLKIENLKCFKKTRLELNYPGKEFDSDRTAPALSNVNLFVGENGAGKTTVCQAICIAVLKTILGTSAAGFRTEGLIRTDETISNIQASVVLSEQDGFSERVDANATIKNETGTEFLEMRGQPAKWSLRLLEENSPSLFLAAYGANRRTERPEAYNERLRNLRYQRIASLFEPQVGLIPPSLALGFSQPRTDEVIDLVNRLLFGPVKLTSEHYADRGQASLFSQPAFVADGVRLPLSGLSDGYRLHIGWVIDLISHLARVMPPEKPLNQAEGIVIVDEIDLLLHAEWQRHVVKTLAETFPAIQFLMTTHSPIVAGTLQRGNIFDIDRVGPHSSEIKACTENVFGQSIDTILVRLFGLKSARAPELELDLIELEKRARNGDQDASIEYLKLLRRGAKVE